MGKKKIKLEEFHAFKPTFYTKIEEIVLDNCQKTASDLRRNPWQTWGTHRAKPPYDTGWTVKMQIESKGQKTKGRVHNQSHWQLTWLLENGHLIVNKKGGVGWAHPHEHISDAYKKNAPAFARDMKEKLDITIELT